MYMNIGKHVSKELVDKNHGTYWSCVCVSPDGTQIAAAGAYETAMLYTVDTSSWHIQDTRILDNGSPYVEHNIRHIMFSPDGTRVIAAHNEGRLRMWDAHNGTQVYDSQLDVQLDPIKCMALSPDGKYIACGYFSYENQTGRLCILQVNENDQLEQLFNERNYGTFAVDWSPDGTRIVVASPRMPGSPFRLRIYKTDTWEVTHEFQVEGHVLKIKWSPDGEKLLLCTKRWRDRRPLGCFLEVINILGGRNEIYSFRGAIRGICWVPNDNEHIVMSVEGGLPHKQIIYKYNIRTGTKDALFDGHKQITSSLAWVPGGDALISASHDRTIHYHSMSKWSLKTYDNDWDRIVRNPVTYTADLTYPQTEFKCQLVKYIYSLLRRIRTPLNKMLLQTMLAYIPHATLEGFDVVQQIMDERRI